MSDESANDTTLAFTLRVLRIFDSFDGPSSDSLWWRTDGKFAPVTFFVKCSDEFHYACADLEPLTLENIEVMEQAVTDCAAADPEVGTVFAPMLFCARVRKMRPLRSEYPDHVATAALFDACGPSRDGGAG